MSSRRNSFADSFSAISDVEGGDLGLGLGRKPGGIVISDHETDFSDGDVEDDDLFEDLFQLTSADGMRDELANRDSRNSALERLPSLDDFFRRGVIGRGKNEGKDDKIDRQEPFKVSDVLKTKRDGILEPKEQKLLHKNLKSYIADFILSRRNKRQASLSPSSRSQWRPQTRHGISLGTSMRQERALFDQEMEKLDERRKLNQASGSGSDRQTESDAECGASDGGFLWRHRKRRLLEARVEKAEEESAALRTELERREELLEAKQKAVKIMQAQVQQVTQAKEAAEEKSKKRIEYLEKEVNGLRFESEYTQGSLAYSQETWAQRFDRFFSGDVCLRKIWR